MTDYQKQQIENIEKKIKEAQELVSADPSMAELAQEDIEKLEEEKIALTHPRGEVLTSPGSHPGGGPTNSSVILEIRSAAGGDEAGLFAADLLRMYQKFAVNNRWQFEELDCTEGGLGNIKTVIVKISGKNVFEKLQHESGVHRVQRVPVTESSGRIHTSTATVAILPEAKEIDIQINPEDIRIDVMRASGAGGQCVNRTDSAVRI